jgi:hypothetical protein
MTNKRTSEIVKVELDAINDQIESAELRLEMAKLEHVTPLTVRVKRLVIERSLHRLENPDDKDGARAFTGRIDETRAEIKKAKRSVIDLIREEIADMVMRKRDLVRDSINGQERIPLEP